MHPESPPQPQPPLGAAPPERIGVVVVHGIGEQKRFEHLDAQVRDIVRGLVAREHNGRSSRVTVEISGGGVASFGAEQDTWASGDKATARVVVRDAETQKVYHIHFHEVWWADVNEPFSLAKQFRFWMWGLVISFIPMKGHSTLASAYASRDPIAPGGVSPRQIRWVRIRLFGVSFVAVLGAMSIGLLTFLAKRLLNLEPPDFIKVFVNYVAGVKLYNQRKRYGRGLPGKQMDFLDSISEPPRVSVRRRMIRVIAQAARANYDRWYIISHSLGTVVAYNGLMESAYAWPGFFDETTWKQLVEDGFAGPARQGWNPPQGPTLPQRPVWGDERAIAYRSKIFERLHGVLMMGTPLEKFATLWPGRVPITAEPAFREGTKWLSIYDPIDPVSGILRAFDEKDPLCSPKPETIGYAASSILLISHIRYLTWQPGGATLADGVARWLVTGLRDQIPPATGSRWFKPYANAKTALLSDQHKSRTRGAWLWWLLAIIVLTAAGAASLPVLLKALASAVAAAWKFIGAAALWKLIGGEALSNAVERAVSSIPPIAVYPQGWIDTLAGWISGVPVLSTVCSWLGWVLSSVWPWVRPAVEATAFLWSIAIGLPLIAGVISRWRLQRDEDDSGVRKKEAALSKEQLAPEPPRQRSGAWDVVDGIWR